MSAIDEQASDLNEQLDLLLEGRFTDVPVGNGPIGHKLKRLADKLVGFTGQSLTNAVGLSMTTNAAVIAAAGMARGVTEVRGEAEGIAAAAEQMAASVENIAERAAEASESSRNAQSAATQCQHSAIQAVCAMDEIDQAVATVSAKINNLSEASERIGEVLDLINSIAFQTNMLALNAGVEAVRAGDAGKGFAVIAQEVKKLSDQTAQATVDIKHRVEDLRTDMNEIVEAMGQSATIVARGKGIITETGDAMSGILTSVEGVAIGMSEVSEILAQQAAASTEMSRGVVGINDMCAENVAAIDDVLDAMGLTEQSVEKQKTVLGRFSIPARDVILSKADHMIWRKKLADMLVGRTRLDPKELSDHTMCRLGKWYGNVEDQEVRNHPAYRRLEAPHREVHKLGIRAAEMYANGDTAAATRLVEQIEHPSQQVQQLLDELVVYLKDRYRADRAA